MYANSLKLINFVSSLTGQLILVLVCVFDQISGFCHLIRLCRFCTKSTNMRIYYRRLNSVTVLHDNKPFWTCMSRNIRTHTLGHMHPVKIQIRLRIRAVWSESSLGVFCIAKDAKFFHAENEGSDQTEQMCRLIYCLFVLRFYGPVNPMGSCRARSVYQTTGLLGRLSPLRG